MAENKFKGKMIEPLSLADNEKVHDFIERVFGYSGFNARRLAEACSLYSRMIKKDTTICLTLAGAMTPIGMSGPIINLIRKGFVDFIISTGANIYHDFHRAFNLPVYQGSHQADDSALYQEGIARIYDTFVQDLETLMPSDRVILKPLLKMKFERPISSADLHKIVGEEVLKSAPHPDKSFVATAAEFDVPIYTPSPGDSSIGMNLIIPKLLADSIPLDPFQDVIETTAIVKGSEKNGAIIIGGGAPKNFYLQTQTTLSQILREDFGGHDYFIQLTSDSPQWGGLSGATPEEAKSWGKVKDPDNCVVVYSCCSITFPMLCQYVNLSESPREVKRLSKKKVEYVKELKEKAEKNELVVKEYKDLLNT
ncbi:MAG: deoxyhypusine synthase [Deltaproteobacteria bacterium]|nr:MAG: deoxyhypusine synthase [Deltaproteobacteria bacterium]